MLLRRFSNSLDSLPEQLNVVTFCNHWPSLLFIKKMAIYESHPERAGYLRGKLRLHRFVRKLTRKCITEEKSLS